MRLIFISIFFCVMLMAWTSAVSGQDVKEVEALNKQILQLHQQGQYAQALEMAIKALKLSEDTLGPEHPETATCLNDLGGMYQSLGDYTNAETMFERGLVIREKVLGPEHQYTARNLMNLGSLYLQMGKYARAEPLLLRALAINQKVLGAETLATATSLSNLGVLYKDMGDYAKSESYFEQVLAIDRKVHGPENRNTAMALNNLASIQLFTGEYDRAEPLLNQALAIREKALGLEHPLTGQTLQVLGTLYYKMGDYARSESFYQRALSIQEKNPGPEHPDTAITLSGLGMLYMDMGDYNKAMPLYLRTLKIQEKVFGPEHPTVAGTLERLGALYQKTGNFAQADSIDQRVLEIDEKTLGPEHPATAAAIANLGALYEGMKDLPKAESYDKRALAIREKVLGPEHPDLSPTLNNLASVYGKMGEYTNAETLFLRALDIEDRVLGRDNPHRAMCLANLATTYFDLQKTNESLEFADKAEQSSLGMLNNILSFTSEQERLNYEMHNDPYILFASLNDAPRVALAILRHKGVVLDSLLEDRLVAGASQNPEDRALIEQLGPAKQQLTQLLMSVPKDTKLETLKSRAETRDKLSRQVEQLEGALAQKVAGFGHARRALTVTVDEVQKAIPPRTALVEFIRYHHYLGRQQWESRYGAVILASKGEPQWVCLGAAAAIEKNVLICQQSVRDKESKNEALLSSALHGLFEHVWKPIQTVLPSEAKTIVLSPDASLNFVSFATLLTPHNKFLCENYSFRYIASGRDLLRKPAKSSGQDMVIFAAPDYIAGGQIDLPETGVQLLPLPHLAKNAADLEAEVKPWNWPVRIYSGVEATETQLRAIHSPRILHFSTHGFFLPETMGGPARFSFLGCMTDSKGLQQQVTLKNPMYRSGIALAGAQVTLDAWKRGETPPTDSDGILSAEEVGDLDLHGTWLVVLSACDTGIGQSRSGEGVMGLRRGFAQAGAQNLLMTLWPVFDVPSGQLMLDFYSALHQNNNPSEALAKVQKNWLVKLHQKVGLLPAVVMAGAFIVNSQGPIQ
jgi:tetratricopeptide (TPR) repeat protein/CHAT domain-containing protein